MNPLLTPPLPRQWKELERSVDDDGVAYKQTWTGQLVITSIATEKDGREWLHVSTSFADRLPTWDELKDVKMMFIGGKRKAIQVFPPVSEYVNTHPFTLHLWCCLTEDVLPDFRKGDEI
jgi:hypothetical protein